MHYTNSIFPLAPIVSIQEGRVRLQKVLILRDRRGPIIQVVYYVNDHINIQNFFVGQTLRFVLFLSLFHDKHYTIVL